MGRKPPTSARVIATFAILCATASPAAAQSETGDAAPAAVTPDPAELPVPPTSPDPGGWKLVLAPEFSVGVAHSEAGFDADSEDAYLGTVSATLLLRHSALSGGEPSSFLYGLRGLYGLGGGSSGARQLWGVAGLLGWRASRDRVVGGIGLSYIQYDKAGGDWVRRGGGVPLWIEIKLGDSTSNWFLGLEGTPAILWRDLDDAPAFAFGLNAGVLYHIPLY
ncbi:MAG: hypothetical protein A3J93_02050 [Candidatus Magasanikbacteria bacterium RIFOXYC2_FULL_42_28]|uniref:Outer membrane protein beta-barrel domain-containing protein n=1 Tax=Candidatus Magasanikbacteria bacterium RIFOXYC2_FULL_42_28 TaxID=1798704 RepID=A0A1F6NWU1_9BACT|nr:MAG: hypothetical protein A3J93_02050 [Candidatus Magasanikbacteria bacterium RIFOXYC2_FULL_42_28]